MPSEQPPTRVDKPRMALRPYHDDPERLDDVVVEDVAMFRAEMMDDGHLWMACYFDKSGTAPDLHFSVIAGKTGRAQLHLSATDVPPHIDIDAAPDEPAPPSEQPREGTRVCVWCGKPVDLSGNAFMRGVNAWHVRCWKGYLGLPAPPRGEGDDLAARLEDWAKQVAWPDPVYTDDMARDLRDAAQLLARASTHPEQSERGFQPFDRQAADAMAEAIDAAVRSGQISSRSPMADARLSYGEPASPTPTEQEDD